MSTPPSAEKKTLPSDPLVTPPASVRHEDDSTPRNLHRQGQSVLTHQQDPQEDAPSPSRAESPSAHQWSTTPANSSSALFPRRKSIKHPLDPERLARLHSPQLSERDSIFATNYLPSDIESLPIPEGLPNVKKPRSHRGETAAATLGPSTSETLPFRTPHDEPSNMEVDVHRPPPHSSPLHPPPFLSPPATTTATHTALLSATAAGNRDLHLTDASAEELLLPDRSVDPPAIDSSSVSEELRESSRGDNREMPHPRARRSSSLNQHGLVENSIEANLANAEPTPNVRSRKSSHYLGLFKENTTSPDRRRKDDRGQKPEESWRPLDEPASEVLPGAGAWSEEDTRVRRSSKSLSRPSLADAYVAIEPSAGTDSHARMQTDDLFKYQYRPLPSRLLEEIRNFHLTPGGARGTSFSKSIPTQYAEGGRHYAQECEPVVEAFSPLSDTLAEQRHGSAQNEDEEEEKEQISSALYFPHERVTVPDEVGAYQADESEQQGGIEPFKVSTEETGPVLISGKGHHDLPSEQDVSHVDISLRSKNDSRVLHGHIPDLQGPLDELYDKPLTTISERSHDSTCESEVPSADESGLSTHDDSSLTEDDGAGMTPTATPTQQHRYLRHGRKHGKAAPVGAVELKPYRHQVGGHTTVFRFSRRAVCKQLNNRENEFYERIERRHPEMLMFLPRCVD